jgi:hypothetical protein
VNTSSPNPATVNTTCDWSITTSIFGKLNTTKKCEICSSFDIRQHTEPGQ